MAVPDRIKTQELCNKAVDADPGPLAFTPDCLKTHYMCNEAVAHNPYKLRFIPDHLKTQEMCNKLCNYPAAFFLFLTFLKLKGCVLKSLR